MLSLKLTSEHQECTNEEVCSEASQLLDQVLPVMLRFMSDEYDDTCSTVFPLLQSILSSVGSLTSLHWKMADQGFLTV